LAREDVDNYFYNVQVKHGLPMLFWDPGLQDPPSGLSGWKRGERVRLFLVYFFDFVYLSEKIFSKRCIRKQKATQYLG
jgi:hypothetical protein